MPKSLAFYPKNPKFDPPAQFSCGNFSLKLGKPVRNLE